MANESYEFSVYLVCPLFPARNLWLGIIRAASGLLRRTGVAVVVDASPDQPEAQVELLQLGQLHDDVDALGTELRAAVEIDGLEISQILGQRLQALVRYPAALSDIEVLQLVQCLGDL